MKTKKKKKTFTFDMYKKIVNFKLFRFSHDWILLSIILQRQLQIRRGRATAGQGVSGRGSLGTERFGTARLLHVCLSRRTCPCTRDLHGGVIVQTSNADLGAASLRTDAGSHGRRVSHPVATLPSEYTAAQNRKQIFITAKRFIIRGTQNRQTANRGDSALRRV